MIIGLAMSRTCRLVSAIFIGLACYLSVTAISLAQSPSAMALGPDWTGRYMYGGENGVVFRMKISASGDRFQGRTCEVATFGDGSSPNLYANIVGTVTGGIVRFKKTYDGTGGVSHSVDYVGLMTSDGRSVAGTWIIPPNGQGLFQMTLGVTDRNKCPNL